MLGQLSPESTNSKHVQVAHKDKGPITVSPSFMTSWPSTCVTARGSLMITMYTKTACMCFGTTYCID